MPRPVCPTVWPLREIGRRAASESLQVFFRAVRRPPVRRLVRKVRRVSVPGRVRHTYPVSDGRQKQTGASPAQRNKAPSAVCAPPPHYRTAEHYPKASPFAEPSAGLGGPRSPALPSAGPRPAKSPSRPAFPRQGLKRRIIRTNRRGIELAQKSAKRQSLQGLAWNEARNLSTQRHRDWCSNCGRSCNT